MGADTARTRARRQTVVDVVGSELIRATTIRSTWWILLLGVVLAIFSVFATGFDDGVTLSTVAINVDAVAVSATAVFGVLSVTDEYSVGTLITTVSATPRRGRILTAKLIVAILFAVVTSVVPLLFSVAILAAARSDGLPLGTAGIFPPFGMAIACVVIAVFSVYFGAVVRNSTIGVTSILAIVFLVPVLSFRLGDSQFFVPDLGISDAASSLVTPLSGYLALHIVVMAIWIVVPAIIGTRLFTRREV